MYSIAAIVIYIIHIYAIFMALKLRPAANVCGCCIIIALRLLMLRIG